MHFRFVSFEESSVLKPIDYDAVFYLIWYGVLSKFVLSLLCLVASLPTLQRCEIIEHLGSRS